MTYRIEISAMPANSFEPWTSQLVAILGCDWKPYGKTCRVMSKNWPPTKMPTDFGLDPSGCFSDWKVRQFRCTLLKIERTLMSKTLDHSQPLDLEHLAREVQLLRERVEDLEDLRDLEQAVADNAGKPLTPWEEVKTELDLN